VAISQKTAPSSDFTRRTVACSGGQRWCTDPSSAVT
jgi:hypothetical protein